jgi:ribosomal-protein-serine acetyltransferase
MTPPVITVDEATRLRPWRVEDVPALYEAVMVDQEHVASRLAWADGAYTVDKSRDFIDHTRLEYERGNHLGYVIEVDGRVGGGIGVPRSTPAEHEYEIGYWLSKPCTGRGVMTRSAEALTDFLFSTWNAHRVQIAALRCNKPSRAVAERLGFILEGVFRQSRFHRGEWHDMAWYAITEDEWAARNPASDSSAAAGA